MRKLLSCFLLLVVISSIKAQSCNNWLFTPSVSSSVSVGDLDITGNKVTVEALVNRTTPYLPGVGDNNEGDIVSKHIDATNINYLLRPNHAYITTTNGFFGTPDICNMELNRTYHIAMVYDGNTLKLFRNGYLMSQVDATGDLFQNDFKTRIGHYEFAFWATQFVGNTNEVRIWKTARTQSEIRTYMKIPLPTPSMQPGLVGYYTFDNLQNKQGNPAFDGVLNGSASINATNANCPLVADSCGVVTEPASGIGDIINDYTPVINFDICENKISVKDASAFNVGDTVLLIQMKGALIDSSNTESFGKIIDYKNAGNYEFNYVKSRNGNVIVLRDSITRQYDIPRGSVQLVRVPYFKTVTIGNTLTCLPWDGEKGGILVFNVEQDVTLGANIDVRNKGFRGGNSPNTGALTLNCAENNYYYPVNSIKAGAKGESIAVISDAIAWGKGNVANGGGGGVGHNSGGGGGSNGGTGGFGGYQLEACGNAPFNNRGIGGQTLTYNTTSNKVFMGGGGGSGHVDNAGGSPMQGGNGGGIIIINAKSILGNGYKIFANGGDAPQCSSPAFANCHDGSGGGGGGGSILVNNTSFTAAVFDVSGGKGADLAIFDSVGGAGRIGPGGGGGAGIVWFNQAAVPAGVVSVLNGGLNGVIVGDNNNKWGATAGAAGLSIFNLKLPIGQIEFRKNIDSVKIKDSALSCSQFEFKGIAYVAKSGVSQWRWDFGDNTTASTQNAVHSYSSPGNYLVKLRITDQSGCTDSATVSIASGGSIPDFTYKQDVCEPLKVQFEHMGPAPANNFWSFGDGITTAGNASPVHSYLNPGSYLVKYYVASNLCADTVVKTISVQVMAADIITTNDTTICFNTSKQLRSLPALKYCWSPTSFLSDPNSASPITSTPQTITYFLTGETTGANLITNGNFTQGNTGFTSQYNYTNTNITEGQYFVGSSPAAWNASLSSCTDHTTGNGNMMLVNGAPQAEVNVWTQNITVSPNTNYAFSTWIQALYAPNPAQLSFSINGVSLGDVITAALPTCTWNQFYTTWNSGSNTVATISIVNKNTFVQGNDFALDDIAFSPVVIKRDSVRISVEKPQVKASTDTSICEGQAVQLSASGAATYSWSPAAGLNTVSSATPTATPIINTQYIVSGTTISGCLAKDTVNISLKALPAITKSNDTTICTNSPVQLFTGGGTNYSWTPASSLSNTAVSNPIATPSANTTYRVTITAANGCSKTDSIKISIRPIPVFSISPSAAACANTSITLNASGGTSYAWTPAASLDDPAASSPVSTATGTTVFSVKIKDDFCGDSASLSTTLTINPTPSIAAFKSNDIDCSTANAQLTVTGADSYVWTPSTGLNNNSVSNPIATINTSQQYLVTGTDMLTKCAGTDTITVFASYVTPAALYIPNAFTPNGDGKNDCFRIGNFNSTGTIDFSIYDREGNRVFHSVNPGACWDGTFKGAPMKQANYVYYLKTFSDCGNFTRKGNVLLVR